jgi:hypothetical protein
LFSASRSCSSIAWNTFALSSAWAFANISETLKHKVQYSTVLQCRNKRFVHPHIRKLTAKLPHYIVDKQKLLGKRIINTKFQNSSFESPCMQHWWKIDAMPAMCWIPNPKPPDSLLCPSPKIHLKLLK